MSATNICSYLPENIKGIPSAKAYQDLLNLPPAGICREPSDSFSYSERHIQCVWFDARLRPKTLTTTKGETVKVVDPGRWNNEAGPDFLDAVLVLGPDRRQICGDVEIHIHPSDWNSHKHAGDRRYNKIIAHVTYTPPQKPITTLPPGTVEISLKKELDATPSFSFEAIDTIAYPYSPLPNTPHPCYMALQGYSPRQITGLLEAAGAHRMQTKAQRIRQALKEEPSTQVIYREIMGALGYKHNSAAFRELAETIPYNVLEELSPLAGYALMLGVSGLIPTKPSPRWDDDTKKFIRNVWNMWWQMQERWKSNIMPKQSWRLASLRPQNHPLRRMAAAASLFCSQNPPIRKLQTVIDNCSAKDFVSEVAKLFVAPAPIDYWHHHISLASPQREKPIAIIGERRVSAICINTLLPYLAASGTDVTPIADKLPPEQTNTIIRRTAYALLGPDHNPAIYSKNCLRQQGLIQIFHDFCINDRSACQDCQFAAAIHKQQNNTPA